jgi:poly-gamma-glutamate synthesis protein (capsule biosynthesis protein)
MDDEFNKGMDELDNPKSVTQFAPPKKKSKKRIVITILVIILLAGLVSVWLFVKSKNSNLSFNNKEESNNHNIDKKTVRLIASGDAIPHDAINKVALQSSGEYEYSQMLGNMKELFDKSDVRFCNQAVLGGGKQFGISGYPKFNSPTEFARDLAELGCNVINTGSNHTNDFKQEVIDASVNAWQGLPGVIAVAGANTSTDEKNKVRYFESNGLKFAFVSYTTYSNEPPVSDYSVTMYSKDLAKNQLAEARSKADFVIVSMRWGTEYSQEVNSQQKELANEVANLGADFILGHGPHVLQPVDQIILDDGRKAIVWYSLGNFLNAQLEPETLFNGIAVIDINTQDKSITNVSYLPIYMHYEWTKEQKQAEDLLARTNFSMFAFDDAQEPLAKSQNVTTLEEQKNRINKTLNTFIDVKLMTKNDYLGL